MHSAMASSLINKPLTSLCNSKSELYPETSFIKRGRSGVNSLSFKNINPSISCKKLDKKKADFSVSCKAVSVEQEPQTEIEGLNIADDVTQVCFYHLPRNF